MNKATLDSKYYRVVDKIVNKEFKVLTFCIIKKRTKISAKDGFKSEDTVEFLHLQNEYSKSLS